MIATPKHRPADAQQPARAGCTARLSRTRRCAGICPRCATCCGDERALSPARLAELEALIDALRHADPLETEADYVELFDRGRATSLHLFEHVHGDSRDRGPAMIDLGQTYEKAGLILAEGELPDYLPAVLEFVSTQPPREARAFLGEMAHILNAMFAALQQRESAYASVLGALLELAGEKAQAGRSRPPRSRWTRAGPSRPRSTAVRPRARRGPGSRNPIHIVRKIDTRTRSIAHERRLRLSFPGLSVRLLHRVHRRQPDPLRPGQYSWKSDSSQMLRAGMLRWGSNLFHFGILFLFFGHLVGLFTPHAVYGVFMSAATKQMLAVVAGGVAGSGVLRRPVAAAVPARVRSAHPPRPAIPPTSPSWSCCGFSSSSA